MTATSCDAVRRPREQKMRLNPVPRDGGGRSCADLRITSCYFLISRDVRSSVHRRSCSESLDEENLSVLGTALTTVKRNVQLFKHEPSKEFDALSDGSIHMQSARSLNRYSGFQSGAGRRHLIPDNQSTPV
jgi:hypothetical protein